MTSMTLAKLTVSGILELCKAHAIATVDMRPETLSMVQKQPQREVNTTRMPI